MGSLFLFTMKTDLSIWLSTSIKLIISFIYLYTYIIILLELVGIHTYIYIYIYIYIYVCVCVCLIKNKDSFCLILLGSFQVSWPEFGVLIGVGRWIYRNCPSVFEHFIGHHQRLFVCIKSFFFFITLQKLRKPLLMAYKTQVRKLVRIIIRSSSQDVSL